MKQFDSGHFFPPLTHLYSITDKHQTAIDSQGMSKQLQDHPKPKGAQGIGLDAGAVKVVEQAFIKAGMKFERAHKAGDPKSIGTNAQASDRAGEPKKGDCAS